MHRKVLLNRMVALVAGLLTVAAIAQELSKPGPERTWHGRVLGVPYDCRRPTRERFVREWWRPEDTALLTPRAFGIGWGVNLARVAGAIRSLLRPGASA